MKLIIKLFKIIFTEQVDTLSNLIKFYAYAGLFLIACLVSLALVIMYNIIF